MKNIIFDVGNVLIGGRWRDMCREAGWDEEKTEKISRGFFENPLWPDFDAGIVSVDELIESVAEKYPELKEEARWFIVSGKKMVAERPKVWELAEKLKEKGFKLYLLSNYSEELFRLHTDGFPFLDLMDGGVISYQIKKIKPDPAIYQYLMQKYQLKPEECLFFDDRPENTEAARRLGMAAVTVENGSEELLVRELERLLQQESV